MQYVDARRLTGPNHLAKHPLVMVELALADGLRDAARSLYLAELSRMRTALGFPAEVRGLVERPQRGGLVIAYVEPIDVMLACAEQSEWAAMSASEVLAGKPALALEPKRTEIEAILLRDRSPRLLALEAEAARRSLPFLWDDEAVSVGLGVRSCTWPRGALPDVADVADLEWARLGAVPVTLVTGTNGKTTSTRWLGKVALEAGKHVGVASSDAISVAGEVLDAGDWTGPAAARTVLRRTDVDYAILETARGGILRRGLAVDRADVALLTNISDDHVGSYGIDDLAAMTHVKAVIAEAARGAGTVVLNAADPRLAALADAFEGTRVVLFADLDGAEDARPTIERHRAKGGEVVVTSGGRLVRTRGPGRAPRAAPATETELGTVATIPLAFGGAARFNVANALGVAAAAGALGLPDDAIRRALVSFTPKDNPRRTALAEKAGVRILLDFGHNADGVRAVMTLVNELRGPRPGRLIVCLGAAGDRTNRDLEETAQVLARVKPDRIVLRDLDHYLRGRAPGEVPEVFRRAFLARGVPDHAMTTAASEVDSLRIALDGAGRGDFVVLLVHLDHDEVAAFLGESSARDEDASPREAM
jgi:UDP-N-acetylmuramyl tripeptide synthase